MIPYAPRRRWLIVLAPLLAAMPAVIVALKADLFELPQAPGLTEVLSLVGVLLFTVWAMGTPRHALLLLVVFVYLNLSEVLVRYHGLPSLLQLASIPLLLAAWPRRRDLEAIAVHRLTVFFAAFLLWSLISTNYAQDVTLAEARVLELAKGFAIFLLVTMFIDSPERLRQALWAMIGAGAFLGALGLFQVTSGEFSENFGGLARVKNAHIFGEVFEPRIAGPLGDPNFFAQILLILVPLSLFVGWEARARGTRLMAFLAAAVLAGATIITFSRGGALALAVVVVLAFVSRGVGARDAVLAVGAVVVLLTLAPSGFTSRLTTLEEFLPGRTSEHALHPDSSFEERRLVTGTAWRMFVHHPLTGVGAANFPRRFDHYSEQVGSDAREYDDPAAPEYPHSLYLETAAELGLIGLVLFAAWVGAAFAGLQKARQASLAAADRGSAGIARAIQIALLGYLVSGLFLHGHFPRYLWLLLALAAAADLLATGRRGRQAPL